MGLKKEEDSPLSCVSSRQLGLETLWHIQVEQHWQHSFKPKPWWTIDGFTSEVVHYGQKKFCCIPMYT